MTLVTDIEQDLKEARLARDDARRDALALLLSSLRSAEKDLQRALSEEESLQVLQRERKKRDEGTPDPGLRTFCLVSFMSGLSAQTGSPLIAGAVLLFINFLALRQAVTPAPLLGRMTSIMRWLILIPAGPGALLGGWLGEHAGLRFALAFGGVGSVLLGLWVGLASPLRHISRLPKLETTENPVHKGAQP